MSDATIGLEFGCMFCAVSAQTARWVPMSDDSFDYRIRFVKRYDLPIEDRSIQAESVTAAVKLAAEIVAELEATDFSITHLPPKVGARSRRGAG
jgi:hypothetical protein